MILGRTFLLWMFLYFLGANCFLNAEVLREAGAVVCAPGMREKVELDSTGRLPGAHGSARLARQGDTTEIDIEVEGMKPAALFGGDYNTYILWAASHDGRVENLGEFILDGTHSRLRASTKLEHFAVIVSAEPHFLVSVPSAFAILQSEINKHSKLISYPVVEGVYYFERGSLDDVMNAAGVVETDVKQALTAVRLAQRSGAPDLATDELAEAERSLDTTMELLSRGEDRNRIRDLARETVRLATAVQSLALKRAFQNARIE